MNFKNVNTYLKNNKVIIHIDLDAFYAQVERRRLNLPMDAPVCVIQHDMLIAVGYPARKFGITRIMNSTEAKKLCPQVNLVPVEIKNNVVSLERYRNASVEIFELLKTFPDCVIEKASIDEAYIDCTEYIRSKLLKDDGNSVSNTTSTTKTNPLLITKQTTPMDSFIPDLVGDEEDEFEELNKVDQENLNLKLQQNFQQLKETNDFTQLGISEGYSDISELYKNEICLFEGAFLANQMRQKSKCLLFSAFKYRFLVWLKMHFLVFEKLQFTSSAGISNYKILSKVGSARYFIFNWNWNWNENEMFKKKKYDVTATNQINKQLFPLLLPKKHWPIWISKSWKVWAENLAKKWSQWVSKLSEISKIYHLTNSNKNSEKKEPNGKQIFFSFTSLRCKRNNTFLTL